MDTQCKAATSSKKKKKNKIKKIKTILYNHYQNCLKINCAEDLDLRQTLFLSTFKNKHSHTQTNFRICVFFDSKS